MKVKLTQCPVCDASLDGAKDITDESTEPKPGDYSICAYCTTFLIYTESFDLRVMTEEEVGELPDEVREFLVNTRIYFMENPLGHNGNNGH